MTLKPKAGKVIEVRQTLESMATAILAQWGCVGCDVSADGDGRSFDLVKTWSDQAAVDSYLGSREHRALIGAVGTLCEHHSLSITIR